MTMKDLLSLLLKKHCDGLDIPFYCSVFDRKVIEPLSEFTTDIREENDPAPLGHGPLARLEHPGHNLLHELVGPWTHARLGMGLIGVDELSVRPGSLDAQERTQLARLHLGPDLLSDLPIFKSSGFPPPLASRGERRRHVDIPVAVALFEEPDVEEHLRSPYKVFHEAQLARLIFIAEVTIGDEFVHTTDLELD